MPVRGDELQRGTVVAGYRIDGLISRGGMGLVYRVTNVALNRIYALKILSPELAEDEHFRHRFTREMRIAASLNHPSIVGIHNAGEHEGLLFFVMDYVTGTDLREILRKQGALEPTRAVDLLEQLASALDAAHGRGLVHRDVKPANILITVKDGEERAYLTDFGLAKKLDTASGLTAKGLMVGTVDYMAPEQITGGHTDALTDIYALGCVFYQMLSGSVPYDRDNSVATLYAHVHEPPPPLEGDVGATYPAFAPVIERAMAKEPHDRYFSAGDFAQAANAAVRGMQYTERPTIVGIGDAAPLVERDLEPDEDYEDFELGRASESPPPVPPDEPPRTVEPGAPDVEPDEDFEDFELGRASESPPPVPPDEPPRTAEPGAPTPPVGTAPAPEADAAGEPADYREATPESVPQSDAADTVEPSRVAGTEEPSPVAGTEEPSRVAGTEEPSPVAGTEEPSPAAGAVAVAADTARDGGAAGRSRRTYLLAGLGALVAIGAVVAVVVLTSGGSSTPPGQPFAAPIPPVPTNRVTGSGNATVRLNGDVASVTVDTAGLLNGQPHAMHIHAGGRGICPPASAAHLHHGHLSISTTDGIKFYGKPQVSLTTEGDTSPNSIVAFSRYPRVGDIGYNRQIKIPSGVAGAIRADNAVVIVHGIDYDHNGIYDNILDRSELDSSLPGEATAPALCGTLVPTKTAAGGAGGRSGATTYTVVLHRSFVPAALSGTDLALLCHLPGADATALSERRTTPATA